MKLIRTITTYYTFTYVYYVKLFEVWLAMQWDTTIVIVYGEILDQFGNAYETFIANVRLIKYIFEKFLIKNS